MYLFFFIKKKSRKKMKKGVDKAEGMWYYNKAVTEGRKNEEMRRKFDERVAGAKTSKKNFKKVLDKLKTT